MPVSKQETRKWTGLVCPACRFVFRIDSAHSGSGVICPGCDHLLSIPRDKPSTTTSAAKNAHGIDAATSSEESTYESVAKPRSSLLIPVSLFLLGILGVFIYSLIPKKSDQKVAKQTAPLEITAEQNVVESTSTREEPAENQDSSSIQVATKLPLNGPLKTKLDQRIEDFINAKTVAELRPFIYKPEENMPLIEDFYQGSLPEYDPEQKIILADYVIQKGNLLMTKSTDNSFVKHIAFWDTPAGYSIDWKNWVAWCDYPWDEIFKKRPSEEITLRVTCSDAHYYSHYFSDDEVYKCIQLNHPSSKEPLYGYVKLDSSIYRDIKFLIMKHGKSHINLTIKVQYPQNAITDNQVYITSILVDGWQEQIDE